MIPVRKHSVLITSLLGLVVLAGLVLRTWNVQWDMGMMNTHPDERSTSCSYAPLIGWPESWEEFVDPRQSPLNPLWNREMQERRSFTYGHFPLYLGVAAGEVLHGLAPALAPATSVFPIPARVVNMMERANTACAGVAVAGRLVMALLDTITILLLFFLGRRIYDAWAGLLAAAFYAFAAQAIQLSHFFAMDPASTTFTVLAVLGGVAMVQDRSWRAAILTGVGAGLAISSKFSALPILAVPVVAAGIVLFSTSPQAEAVESEDPIRRWPEREEGGGRAALRVLLGVPLALFLAALTFAITSPYAILDWENFIQATLVEQGAMVRGVADFPFTRQYRNTTPYLYFIEQQVAWGLWWPLGVVALIGTIWAALKIFAWRARPGELIVWAWVVPYFGLTGAFLAKFNRYMSPVLPFVLLFAAGLIWTLWHVSTQRREEAGGRWQVAGGRWQVAGGSTQGVPEVAAPRGYPRWQDPEGARGGSTQGIPEMAGSSQQPTANSQQPTASSYQPAAGSQQPTASSYQPAASSQQPAASSYQPAASSRQPAANSLQLYGLRSLAILLAVIGIAGGLFWSLAYVNGVYNTPHPWALAARWLAENAEPGAVVLCEQWDDCIWDVPNEGEVSAANAQLARIYWGPYEEDTAQKYEILREKLREADYVYYSSKRIYDSVDELPERYPMTTRYYDLMFSGELGFALVADITTPPALWGIEFPDQAADESWSLYDHPRVTIFEKVRDLSDAEFSQLLGGTWEEAIPYYRGEDSPIDPLLNALGLGSSPASQNQGLINRVIALLRGEALPPAAPPAAEERAELALDVPLNALPVVDDYRWNTAASENTWLGVVWWWLVVSLLGWLAWPVAFVLFRPLRDRGYLLSRTLGWLLAGWLLWVFASFPATLRQAQDSAGAAPSVLAHNTVVNAWLAVAVVAVLGLMALVWNWREIGAFLRRMGPLLLVGEVLFAGAYLFFVVIRLYNPDIWQPWFGGEKFMEFAFLNGILRSPTFPPVDPHFAGGYINYYYFGIYLVAYLIKLTGMYAEVAFNLAIPTLFALTVVNAFGVAYSAVAPVVSRRGRAGGVQGPKSKVQSPRSKVQSPESEVQSSGGVQDPGLAPDQGPKPVLEPAWDFSDYRTWGQSMPANGPHAPRAVSPLRAETGVDVLDIDMETEVQSPTSNVQSAGPAASSQQPAASSQQPPASSHQPPELLSWRVGVGWALLAPLFVAVIGNLDGFAQIVRHLIALNRTDFQSAIPGVQTTVYALSGLWTVLTTDARLPVYDFWGPSRVIGAEIQATINEFPYWSFTFADLHPHMIGIPFSVLFLGLALAVLLSYRVDWRQQWRYGALLLGGFALLLGTLASINLWELPTYFGLGVLVLAVSLFRGRGRVDWLLLGAFAALYLGGAYLLFWPFFSHYENVGASGVGLVRGPDRLGQWLLMWGFFFFVLVGWLLYVVTRPARPGDARATGLERWLSLAWRNGERLPRLLHLHSRLVRRPSVWYLLGQWLVPLLIALAVVLAWREWTILALCLPCLGLSFLLLWRRGRAADAGNLFAMLLATTGFALLAGTQVFFLKDFLQGGDWYRMNTLFKFFIQVWVLWGVAAAVAVARILGRRGRMEEWAGAPFQPSSLPAFQPSTFSPIWRNIWVTGFAFLLAASLAYPIWGTPARLDQRFPGWRPPIGTLDGLDFMRQGTYTLDPGGRWDDLPTIPIELHGDWLAIQWLLQNMRGNHVIVESAETDYYRAGGTRIASMTGLSGLNGKHESEQRYGEHVGERSGLFYEFWETPDVGRTQQLIEALNVSLIYVGQIERHLHAAGVEKLARMAADGLLTPIYANEGVLIYAVPGQVMQTAEGQFVPVGRLAIDD